jgi:uncharacterized protein
MSEVPDIELPLLDMYQKVVALDTLAGHHGADTNSYLQLIELLRRRLFIISRKDLLFLCAKLWLKPFHEHGGYLNEEVLGRLIDEAFDSYADKPVGEAPDDNKPPEGGDTGEPSNKKAEEKNTAAGGDKGANDDGKGDGDHPKDQPTGDPEDRELYIGEASGGGIEGVEARSRKAESRTFDRIYLTKGVYLPVSIRRIEQTVRSYRHKGAPGSVGEIDLDATLQAVARKGYFEDYVRRRLKTFTTDWTLLIDHDGSMVAFSQLSEAIARAAVQQHVEGERNVFYFRNCPARYVYRDLGHTLSERLDWIARGPKRNILIISDAGAARGNYNFERTKATFIFLRSLAKHRIAWLNPLPKRRWEGTTAEMIALNVNMFELGDENTDQLGNIVRLFKSKIGPAGL